MNILRPLIGFITFIIISCSSYSGEVVDVYYSANQKVFKISGFEDGVPTMEEESDARVLGGSESFEHESWIVKGELPLDSEFAMPITGYLLKLKAKSYSERFDASKYRIGSYNTNFYKTNAWIEEIPNAIVVLGWVVDGKVRNTYVTRVGTRELRNGREHIEIAEADLAGYPLFWVISDGEIVGKPKSEFYDDIFFEPDYTVLASVLGEKDSNGNTLLHYACSNGLNDIVSAILDARSKLIRDCNEDDISPLSQAVVCGRTDVVTLLMSRKASLIDGWSNMYSIVRRAASHGHFETLKILAPTRSKGKSSKWHYSWAASDALNENYEDIALYLIGNGAEISISDSGKFPLVLSKFANGYPELGFSLMERFKMKPTYSDNGYNLFHAVASYADIDLLNRIRDMGANLKQETSKGILPVDVAVGLGNVEGICWFIDNGGRGVDQVTAINPVSYAISNGQRDSVECLVNYGFDINEELFKGVTPLMFAVIKKEMEIARTIAKAGGVWLIGDARMDTVIARILESDAVDLLESAIKQGWKRDRKLMGEFSLMQAAAFYGAEAILQDLSQRGWDDEKGQIPSISSVSQKPKLLTPLNIDYPSNLQAKYGDRDVAVNIALNSAGQPTFVKFEDSEIEADLIQVVESSVYALAFSPAKLEDEQTSVVLKVRLPLKAKTDFGKVFEAAAVGEKPYPIQLAKAVYPYELQYVGAEGMAVVAFTLQADGSPIDVRAIEYNHEAFARSAEECVKRTRWQPAKNDGIPVACRVQIPILFSAD